MLELLKCAVAILVSGYIYVLFGMIVMKKQEISLTATLLLGFFVYFALFQFFAVPMVLMKRSLHELTVTWGVVVGILVIVGTVYCIRKKCRFLKWDWRKQKSKLLIVAILFLLVLYYALRYGYNGFDTSYYIGTVNTSLYTDSMYIFDGNTGVKNASLELRYALSAFYMNSAVSCQIFGLRAAVEMRIITGFFCVLLFHLVVFQAGRIWFAGDMGKALCTVGAGSVIVFFFRSGYTPAQFLLRRSYEAKAYCANIVLPMLFVAFFCLWKYTWDETAWKYIFFICMSCNAISMSCILTVPVMLSVYFLFLFFREKKKIKLSVRYAVCMIPCMVYVVTYVLYLKGFIMIKV